MENTVNNAIVPNDLTNFAAELCTICVNNAHDSQELRQQAEQLRIKRGIDAITTINILLGIECMYMYNEMTLDSPQGEKRKNIHIYPHQYKTLEELP